MIDAERLVARWLTRAATLRQRGAKAQAVELERCAADLRAFGKECAVEALLALPARDLVAEQRERAAQRHAQATQWLAYQRERWGDTMKVVIRDGCARIVRRGVGGEWRPVSLDWLAPSDREFFWLYEPEIRAVLLAEAESGP
jgi:hypothetical protein